MHGNGFPTNLYRKVVRRVRAGLRWGSGRAEKVNLALPTNHCDCKRLPF